MKLLKQAMAVLGTVVVIAALVAVVTPKAVHAVVATFVQVVNTPSQPVPIKDVQSQFGSPFFVEVDCIFPGTNRCIQPLLDAPSAGQVAKIEYVSVQCQLSAGDVLDFVDIQTPYFSSDNFLNISGAVPVPGFGPAPFGQTVSIYALSGNPVRVIIDTAQSDTGRCFVSLNGFTVSQ
jgi:hypothetical protein